MIVTTLFIKHPHGYDLSVHVNDVAANIALATYVKHHWQTVMGDKSIPEDAGTMIGEYFDKYDGFFAVEEQDVLDEDQSEEFANDHLIVSSPGGLPL